MEIQEVIKDPNIVSIGISTATIVVMQIIKSTNTVAERWLPALSFVIAFGLSMWYQVELLQAILVGGSAAGIYDLVKQSIAGK